MTSQTLSLNLIPKGVCPRLYVSQYDKGQEWNFDIYAGTETYTIPSGSSVTIQGTKPDKTGFQYACSFSGNRVTATEQQQMTIIAGEVPAEIRIEKNNEIIATLNFIIAVEKAALADDTVISETDLPLIEEAIEVLGHADELVSQIQGYATTAQNAASTATTKASQASTSATNASNSATTASNAATTATNKASEATSAASTATTKASQASTSATSAAGSASTATTKAQEAAASAAAAAQSAAHLTIDSAMSTTSENALQNKVVTSSIQNLSNQVNYNTENGVKNALPFPYDYSNKTTRTIVANVNVDGSISISGTNSSTSVADVFHFSGYLSDGTWIQKYAGKEIVVKCEGLPANSIGYAPFILYDSSGTQLSRTDLDSSTSMLRTTIPSNVHHVIFSFYVRGSKTISTTLKPMFCESFLYDIDSSWSSPAHSNVQLTQETTGLIDNQNVNGAVNFHQVLNTSQVINGITWTVNDDETVTANGTATADSVFKTQSKSAATAYYDAGMMNAIAGKTIRFSGCPKNGSSSTYFLRLYIANDGGSKDDFGDGYNRTISSSFPNLNFSIECTIKSGQTVSNLVFKPMISLASLNLSYDDYVPFAKSNKELTEDVAKLTIKTATFSANTGTNGIVASGIPEAKAPKCIPISVSFTSTAPPPCVGFEYNNSYGSWYIRCKSWDGSLRLDSDVAGTIRYIDLN